MRKEKSPKKKFSTMKIKRENDDPSTEDSVYGEVEQIPIQKLRINWASRDYLISDFLEYLTGYQGSKSEFSFCVWNRKMVMYIASADLFGGRTTFLFIFLDISCVTLFSHS